MGRETWVVIGSSRGLGAALVEALLERPGAIVAGLARTPLAGIPGADRWQATGRYAHHVADLADPAAGAVLARLAASLPRGPLTLIFNAAFLERDVLADGRIDFGRFDLTNRVNVDGFGRTLAAFQELLFASGGLVVGVSSINAVKPPILEPRVAYGPTKAYLSMALRTLALAWPRRIRCMEARFGHIGADPGSSLLVRVCVPTYRRAARALIARASRRSPPRQWTYPFAYRLAYNCLLRLIPDAVLVRLGRR
ncbi:MAG TPA: SDR family oxidoreductase [Candidatus Methanoperedens sp.]|nr:SDR family oxidoreductase [Candidatus Methanoperedens sp.]